MLQALWQKGAESWPRDLGAMRVFWQLACVAGAVALEPVRPRVVATKRAVVGGCAAAALARVVGGPGGAWAAEEIDMERIRALSAKTRGGLNPAPPKDRDPRDRSLADVVLGWNGAVVRLEPEEVREMERVGLLVKDGFRGRPPDYLSLRDFQPRGWYSAPLESQLSAADRVLGQGVDKRAALAARVARINASVDEKVAAVGGAPPPAGWLPPERDDGSVCGVGAYASACAEKTRGQRFLEGAVQPPRPPPEKRQFEPVLETLSRKYLGGGK